MHQGMEKEGNENAKISNWALGSKKGKKGVGVVCRGVVRNHCLGKGLPILLFIQTLTGRGPFI